MAEQLRPAATAGVAAMTEMADARRRHYVEYQPVLRRPAENAAKLHQPYLGKLVSDEDVITLVAEPGDFDRGASRAVGNGGTGGSAR